MYCVVTVTLLSIRRRLKRHSGGQFTLMTCFDMCTKMAIFNVSLLKQLVPFRMP